MTGAGGNEAAPASVTLHASTVAFGPERGILILGPSGSGKSALALQLMAWGAALVADDRTEVSTTAGYLTAAAPEPIRGLIEARGVGILRADSLPKARLVLAVDMGQVETDRLPPQRSVTISGIRLPLLHNAQGSHFPAAIAHYIRGGRYDDAPETAPETTQVTARETR